MQSKPTKKRIIQYIKRLLLAEIESAKEEVVAKQMLLEAVVDLFDD